MFVNFMHGLYLTCTKISLNLQIIHCNIYKMCSISTQPDPLHFNKTTLLYLLGEPAFLLVVTNTHLPLSLVCHQKTAPPSHPFTPHSSNYIIYIDNINDSRSSLSRTLIVDTFTLVLIPGLSNSSISSNSKLVTRPFSYTL